MLWQIPKTQNGEKSFFYIYGFNQDIMKLSKSAELGVKLAVYHQNVSRVIL